jgi:two-component sensor histidine kinase
MATKSTAASAPLARSSFCLEYAPSAIAALEGAAHIVRFANPAFCRLLHKAEKTLVGKPFREIFPDKGECMAMADRVHRTGKFEAYTERERTDPHRPDSWSYVMWPVIADRGTAGVMVQVMQNVPLYEKTRAMNEALILGSLRQHELTAVANSSNIQLKTEVGEVKRRELDAQLLTNEISHRIKNNLQLIAALINREARAAAVPCVQGYEAIQSRIEAIAALYDLISLSSYGETVSIAAYLGAIAKAISASLLGEASQIKIEVESEALNIDPDRAVPLGLLVNELVTNAIKHAFPDGTGRVVLRARRIGDHIELDVADNGVGMKAKDLAKASGGGAYVATFVRQLRAALAVLESEETGTTVRIRLPCMVGS